MTSHSEPSRRLDLVLLGATGFTGGLTADYLAEHAPDDLRWALAGRDPERLARVRDRIVAQHPRWSDLEVMTADSSDRASLDAVAQETSLVISTVGPYLQHGEPLVAACAAAGTDYVDLTGEPEFVDRMYLAHHATAVATGARLVHACGFDSVPHDLGAYFTVGLLPDDVPIELRGVVRSAAQFSGGTFHSAIGQFARLREAGATARERRKQEGRPEGRRVKAAPTKPHHDATLNRWLVPLPTIDPQIVLRSAAALESYGPDFSYAHYASVGSPVTATVGMVGVGAIAAGSRVPFLRSQMLKRIDRGQGPSESRRARSSFTVTFVAIAGGRKIITRVSGGDPGYTETSMMIAESAMCLAFDDLPPLAGQLTTARAMGDALLERVERGGLTFEVLSA